MSDASKRDDEPRDEQFEELARLAGRLYHPPPETPRETIWAHVRAVREASRPIAPRVDEEPRVLPLRASRAPWRDRRVWLAAAMLLLGVALGRLSSLRGPRGRDLARAPGGTGAETTLVATRGQGASIDTTPSAEQRPASREESAAGSSEASPGGRAASAAPERSGVAPRAYELAAAQHLGQAEALLTSFRAQARSGAVDGTQLASWARDLLGTTRLLLDSPAADDPQLKRLLDDLEVVLVQLAQLPSDRARGDLDLIDQSIEQRGVITKLRATIPARLAPAGT
jgi:hypothetical protein